MLKKKLGILLFVLLVVLLQGLLSTCYAFSEDDCKSLIYNTYVKAWNWNSEQAYNQINAINWTNWNNYFDNNNYQLFYTANSGTLKLAVRYKTGKPYNVNNGYGNVIWGTSFVGFWVNYKNVNNITTNPTNNTTSNFEWYGTGNVYYTELDVYTASNSSTKVITAGSSNRNWLFDENEYNKQEVFGFQEVETNTHVKLASDGVSMPLYYSLGSSVYFADFIDNDGTGQLVWNKILTGDELYMYYYTVNDWTGADLLFKRDFNNISDFKSNRYINVNRQGTYTENKLSLKIPYVLTNVVYNYIINYREDGIDKFVNYYFYVGDNNTATIDNVIDVPTSIPDMETYHNRISNIAGIINNNENTDNIVNTVESGDKNIISALTDTTLDSGEEPTSGDIPQIEIEDITEDFFSWLLTEFVGVLNYSGVCYIDIPIYGDKSTQRIYSNEFILSIEPLRTFISIGWWFLCGVPFLKFIRKTIEHLKGGNVPLSDDKSDLLGNIL